MPISYINVRWIGYCISCFKFSHVQSHVTVVFTWLFLWYDNIIVNAKLALHVQRVVKLAIFMRCLFNSQMNLHLIVKISNL